MTDATVEAPFASGRRAGHPALTVRAGGAGVARYLATVPDEAGAQAVVDHVLSAAGVEPVVAGLPEHVEAARRGDVVTVVNHGGRAGRRRSSASTWSAADPSTASSSVRSTGRSCAKGEHAGGYDADDE